MDNRKGSSLEAKEFYKRTKDFLKLKTVLGNVGFSRKVSQSSSQKDCSSVQVWGKKEIRDLENLSSKEKKGFLRKRLKDDTLCVILADNLSFFPEIKEKAKKRRLALFRSLLSQKICRERMKSFFPALSPDQVTIPGGLLQISGLGVLIVGDSGIGKSESSLELISRGYRFVCDDVVQVKRETNGKLVGKAPPISRYFMEIRGLGIINIKEIFGPKAVSKQFPIDLVIKLEKRQRGKEFDRLGLKAAEDYEILGVKISQINIPVAPGRNIATLIEVACKVHILKEKGYRAPQDLVRKLNRALSLR